MLYPRDPSLDPQLVWRGKDEQDSADLEVPERIHEGITFEHVSFAYPGARERGEVLEELSFREDAGRSQVFLKAGTRNAMVIAVANLAMVVDRPRRAVRVALGSVGPTILRAAEAEDLAAGLYEESGWDRPLRASEAATARFGELAAAAARPIDDQRGTARYRRHIVAVMARRALARTGAAA